MQVIDYLPEATQLALPNDVANNLIALLIEPFGDVETAHDFWSEYPSRIICLEAHEDMAFITNTLTDVLCHLIEDRISTPEFTEDLPSNYQCQLFITSDEGTGIYLIKPAALNLHKDT
ncbi:hypothetical protein CMT41_16395 [Colwellia sp. MT41]|uniref:hypothetical protein n=1 Tax=Colwellia sp. MT41 TaxID=58049 RepID=UPI0007175645|nr:hypothetical protein [Colwellia sp. MT41]ALO36133.1 hypothetical protein CMT41_16395 [Colwellia sp. MT41]